LTQPHVPVLLAEVLEALGPVAGKRVVDATFGAGGYTRAFLERGANVIAFDRDPTAIAAGADLVAEAAGRLALIEAPFGEMEEALAARGFAHVDAVVFDLGVSSMQLDRAERGFSFRFDGPLDMRMGAAGPSAADLVATLSERALADVLYAYGEERRSRAIAAAIVRARAAAPFATTRALADIVAGVLGRGKPGEAHPATRTFQALRIAVNRELEQVAAGLIAAERLLAPGGRLVVVTFHSLEDRIAKTFMAERSKTSAGSRHLPAVEARVPSFMPVTRKAVEPTDAEVAANPRARSAKLRAAERGSAPAHPADLDALGIVPLEALTRATGGRR
jgi:16S rRNA (cytosine1402-N4)-methyltransferase